MQSSRLAMATKRAVRRRCAQTGCCACILAAADNNAARGRERAAAKLSVWCRTCMQEGVAAVAVAAAVAAPAAAGKANPAHLRQRSRAPTEQCASADRCQAARSAARATGRDLDKAAGARQALRLPHNYGADSISATRRLRRSQQGAAGGSQAVKKQPAPVLVSV